MFSTLSSSQNFSMDESRPISAIIIGDGTKRFKVEQAPSGNIRLEGFPKTQRIKLVVSEPPKANDSRTNEQANDDSKPPPTDQKKVMHREIERKRRDRINDWIMTLAKKVPSCQDDHTKQGQSKSGILAKTATYIDEMKQELARVQNLTDELFNAKTEINDLRLRCMHLETENEKMKETLDKHKIKIDL